MRKSYSIGKYIFRENLSNKIINGFLFFSVLIILSTFLLKELTIYKSSSIIKDSGIVLIEFFVFLITVFNSSSYLIKDHKEKSIYLILTKPVSRTEYIFGNLLGNLFLLVFYIISMTIVLELVLLYIGDGFVLWDFIGIFFIFFKLIILSALGIFFAVVSDSYVTANIFTFFVYITGHFTGDLLLIVEKSDNFLAKVFLNIFYYILPRYDALNLRDYLKVPDIEYMRLFIYIFSYTMIISIITSFLFEKRKL